MPSPPLPARARVLLLLCLLCWPEFTPGAELRVRSEASAADSAEAADSADAAANPLVLLRGRVRNLQRQANVLQDLGAFGHAAAVLRHADDQLTASPFALPMYCR